MSSLSIKHLVKEYVPGKPVLKDISLDIEGRGITAIIGPSGTGKSTLIRCINRLVNPTAGEILFEGKDLAKLSGQPLREARRRIGMVFQEYNLVERLSVMENVLSGRLGYVSAWTAWRRKFDDADIQKAFGLLKRVGLADFANRRADELSGGQRQRVGIARAVMQAPGLLLADEPTSSLDPKTSVEIMELMRDLAAAGMTMLVVTHEMSFARDVSNKVMFLHQGRVEEEGNPKEIFAHPKSERFKQFISSIY